MSTTLLDQRFGIRGYSKQHFADGCTFFCIEQPRERLRCRACGSDNVWVHGRTRAE